MRVDSYKAKPLLLLQKLYYVVCIFICVNKVSKSNLFYNDIFVTYILPKYHKYSCTELSTSCAHSEYRSACS